MPRLTVLMPVYNVARYVAEAVQCVLQQTYKDFELLVVDDCSTDGTVAAVQAISDPRLRLVRGERNVGLADNLNRGLEHIHTEFMARMDGDDLAHPQWLEHIVAYMDAHPEVGVCGAGFERFGAVQSVVRLPESHAEVVAGMLVECSTAVPVVRMELLRQHGLRYRASAFPAEDYRLWADCLPHTQLHNLPLSLFRYRMHPTQICSTRADAQRQRVADVRREVLHTVCPQADEECAHYLNATFAQPRIASAADLRQRRAFAARLAAMATGLPGLDVEAMERMLQARVDACLYNTVVERHFGGGYSLRAYGAYLRGGLALRSSLRHEVRFAAKSILHRRK